MSCRLSRPLRFLQVPQQKSLTERRPTFTVPAHIRESLEKNNPGEDKCCGWVAVIVRDLDAHFQPQVVFLMPLMDQAVMWVGYSGSGELHFVGLDDHQLPFFVPGHQYLIEVIEIDGRIPNSRERSVLLVG
jgi:hypothetical protein